MEKLSVQDGCSMNEIINNEKTKIFNCENNINNIHICILLVRHFHRYRFFKKQ